MYIEPNTTIKLLNNVKLDDEYKNSIMFDDEQSQFEYFSSKLISPSHLLENYSYQRVSNGKIRVALSADKCYNCNYLMFRNTNYNKKWFYAFVTNVEYVNNECCHIYFTIDDIQTWLFDVDLLESYVEREHSASDKIGENLLSEPVPIGEYVANEVTYKWFDNLRVVIQFADNGNIFEGDYYGAFYKNIYSALRIMIPENDAEQIGFHIKNIQETGGKIVNIYMTPDEFIPREDQVGWSYGHDCKITVDGGYGLIDGYSPRNKKLFTYPYNYCNVSASNGASVDYAFEYGFRQNFRIVTNMCNSVSATLYNPYYKGIEHNLVDAITLDNFPICAWSDSAFYEYMGTQAIADGVKGTLALFGGAITSIVSSNPLAMVGAGVGVINKIVDVANMRNKPMRVGNTGNNVNNLMNDGKYGFTFSRQSVKREIAKVIDNYFDMYGYATHLTKVPNRKVRKHWTYTKTNGCNVNSRAPIDATKHVCQIYDNGITFWVNGDEIGNYSLEMRNDNAIKEVANEE